MDTHLYVKEKNRETYVFHFLGTDAGVRDALWHSGLWAANKELDWSWYDAMLMRQIIENVEEHEDGAE